MVPTDVNDFIRTS